LGLPQFAKIAPYFTNPYVVVAFGLFLFFGVLRKLIKSGLLPAVSQRQSSVIILTVLKYAMWVMIAVVLFGIAYVYSNVPPRTVIQQTGSCNSIVAGDNSQSNVNCDDTKAGAK
jgi:hypothetical protein